ncbi:hypothetical protein L914_04539 [Phytophthora nicotianae]|uniref:Uncharacterized protein n=2 Tax=Phytophthora nicotianae TaxID=4792 RepID=V9FLV8_PHYNI|nr:hypothetical protein F443_04714 [Phytophthora nicotianae P1569]ETM51673.1 hypothetical protein L914_04539 [Phytophthora nicotianae]
MAPRTLVHFTAEEEEFADLNDGIKTSKVGKLLGSILGSYDPLVRSKIALRGFNYSALGQDLTISTAIDSINITGLTNFVPQDINVTSPNSVSISTASSGQVTVDAQLSATVEEKDVSATAHLQFVLEQPTITVEVEANMYACAPDVSASVCSNLTIADLQTDLESATNKRHFVNIMKEVLMRFKDASVKSFTLDFESISDFDLSFDSSSFVFRNLLRLVPDYSAEDINKKGSMYETYVTTMNRHAPTVLNYLIDATLEPLFGATCLSEE